MKDLTELQQRQYLRMLELSNLARQRYLDNGGDPHRSADDNYLSGAERQEFLELGRLLGNVRVIDGYVYCQGRSWKIPDL
ncbi:MAG: hypothetical protein HC772_07055 [Leptolyngbyaceae cyanobacterium CRU_2_3]|nr:hypothetical protein [Leptolyngbyaceae cyanobacterium CRU_2_3]